MNKLTLNIISIFKDRGKEWLENLPALVQELTQKWGLSYLELVNNLSFNYVLKGLRDKQPIVLKIGLDYEYLEIEAMALTACNGQGAVKLYEFDKVLGAMLLEQAIPGDSLISFAESNNAEAIKITCPLIAKIHKTKSELDYNFPNISEWLFTLAQKWNLPTEYLITARKL